MNIYEKLSALQARISVPKSRFNSFGNYHYRSLEDIFEAIKKPLEELKLALLMADDIAVSEGRFYIKATATLINTEKPSEAISVSAFAREVDIKKGMDPSQITGAASSYARKYALSGLLLLDDNQDADTEEPQQHTQKPKEEPEQQKHQSAKEKFDKQAFVKSIQQIIDEKQLPDKVVQATLKLYGLQRLDDVATKEEAVTIWQAFKNIKVEKITKGQERLIKEGMKEAKNDKGTVVRVGKEKQNT